MRRTTPAIAVLSLGVALTLSGCFANPLEQLTEGIVEGGVEQIIEDQTGVDVDIDGTGASLPADWPAEVPTVEGDIAFSASANDTFSAAITVGSIGEGEQAFTDLTDAGFVEVSALDLGEGAQTRIYENGTYNVGVIVAQNDDGTALVQYTITLVTP
ncbi:MAG: hypothetical protein B7Y93_07810 [Micrococcales bacterium 32-70-13]|nr:MAG: hypothetical protein B7Y93_07810 [Micrococcales bacterium 32-70-13]